MSHFVVNKHGLNIAHSQHISLPQMKHESIIIPSTSAPTWGGYFVIDLRERNCILHDLVLQFNKNTKMKVLFKIIIIIII